MPKPYSVDLRARVIEEVETGASRRETMVGTTNRSMADDLRQVDLNGEANKFKRKKSSATIVADVP
jgi:hypothetical protein